MKTTLLFAFFLSTFLFSSCQKKTNSPDLGKVKYIFSTTLATPLEFTIQYRNDFGEENEEIITNTGWVKSIDYSKIEEDSYKFVFLDVYTSSNGGDNLPNFTGTLKIYKDGKLVNEKQVDVNDVSSFNEYLSYDWE
jgi:hypothetical protein